MSWVLVALVLLIVALLIHFLRQIVETVAKNRYYPPSDAIFDQVLPEEVFEQVLSFADPLMLLRCQSVSKYWHYQASKRHIKLQVLNSAIDEVRNLPQIRSSIREDRIWMNYSPNYKIEHRLADFALAQKQNKYLLEIKRETPAINLRDLDNHQKYIIKIRGKVVNYPTIDLSPLGTFAFSNGSAFASVIQNKNPNYYNNHEYYEILAPLDKCNYPSTPELLMCRPANPIKRFGFIALDGSLVKVMAMLFTPLIVHDVLHSNSFLNILKQWFGTASFLFLITWYYFANKRMANNGHGTNTTFFRKLTMINIALALIGFITLYPSSTDHFAFVAIFVSLFAYGFFVSDHAFEYVYDGSHGRKLRARNNNELKLFAVILALVIFMNDWTLVYKSTLDRTIFKRLFRNTMHYALFVLYCIWNNSMLIGLYATQAERWRVFGRFLVNWDRSAVNLILTFYAAVVFATLYAPYWTGA